MGQDDDDVSEGHRGWDDPRGTSPRFVRRPPAASRSRGHPGAGPHRFEWIDCQDSEQSVLGFLRWANQEVLVVVVNFTPVPRIGYRIGVPVPGSYREIFNSDSEYFGGSNLGNGAAPLETEDQSWMGRPHSLAVNLPPLAGIVLRPGGLSTGAHALPVQP